jgi:hypothetical protein
MEFLQLEGCVCDKIVIPLGKVYGSDTYCCTSVFRWISEIRRGNEELQNGGRSEKPDRHETNAAIRPMPQEDPNALLRTIAETLSISPETIRSQMSLIDYTLKTLHWIPGGVIGGLK